MKDASSSSLYSSPWPLYSVTVVNIVTGIQETLTCEALFNATGRAPNVTNLNLDQVSVSPLSPLSSHLPLRCCG
jgi:hypothetical protein